MSKYTNNINNALRHAIFIGAGAFFLAILATFVSQLLLDSITSLIISLVLLLIIILVGVMFDVIGVAAAAANEAPLHAKAAKKVKGAVHAIKLVREADKVNAFCNDVVGDVSGTLSGAVGAAIVLRIIAYSPSLNEVIISILMTSLVAALMVFGKAFCKSYAIRKGTDIIFQIGRLLALLEDNLKIKVFTGDLKKGRSK